MKIEHQLSELEERANHLDKMRTSTISSISYINNRNRKRNVEEAEKAILVNLQCVINNEIYNVLLTYFIFRRN